MRFGDRDNMSHWLFRRAPPVQPQQRRVVVDPFGSYPAQTKGMTSTEHLHFRQYWSVKSHMRLKTQMPRQEESGKLSEQNSEWKIFQQYNFESSIAVFTCCVKISVCCLTGLDLLSTFLDFDPNFQATVCRRS